MLIPGGTYTPPHIPIQPTMTPAILIVKKARIHYKIHEYNHDSNRTDYGIEAVLKLNINPNRVIKTLIAKLKPSEFVVAMIPVAEQLSMKKLARAAGAKHASMAPLERIKALTGYLAGGISPLGQKQKLACFLDQTTLSHATVFISGGRRGVEIELFAKDLIQLTDAVSAELVD